MSAPVVTVDTPEFRALSFAYAQAIMHGSVPQSSQTWAALVDRIDAHTEQAVAQGREEGFRDGLAKRLIDEVVEEAKAHEAGRQEALTELHAAYIAEKDRADKAEQALEGLTIEDLKNLAAKNCALVPIFPDLAMCDVMDQDDFAWEDLLAAVAAITEDQYADITARPQPSAQTAEQRAGSEQPFGYVSPETPDLLKEYLDGGMPNSMRVYNQCIPNLGITLPVYATSPTTSPKDLK